MQVDKGKGGVHPNHMQNRIAYAERLLAFLDVHVTGARASSLAAMNGPAWHRCAELAGETAIPSSATISMIVGMVRMRENIAAKVGSVNSGEHRLLADLPEARRQRETV